MNSSSGWRVSGYILVESLLALTVTFILASALSGIVLATTRNTGRIGEQLEAERLLTAAQITVLVMIRRGDEGESIKRRVESEYPSVRVEMHNEHLTLRIESAADGKGILPSLTIAVPRPGGSP